MTSEEHPDRLLLVAEHEAAHAVMRYEYGRMTPGCQSRFRHVTIIPEGGAAGHLQDLLSSWGDRAEEWRYEPIERQDAATRRRVEHDIMVALAGTVWDEMHGRWDKDQTIKTSSVDVYVGVSQSDIAYAFDVASLAHQSQETTEAYVEWLWARTRDFLGSPPTPQLVTEVGAALIAERTLAYDRFKQIVWEFYDGFMPR